MTNSVFDSNLKLLGNNIAKCHQLIAEALKVNSREQNENACQHRVRRLCNSQTEQEKARAAPNSFMNPKTIPGKSGAGTNAASKSNVNFKNHNSRDKASQVTRSMNFDRKPANQGVSSSSHSKHLENYKMFSATKTVTGNKNNPPRLSKARCPPAGTARSKSQKTRTQEKQKSWSNILREQNAAVKNSGSDTDNQCMLCDQAELLEGPAHSVSCSHIVHSDFSANTKTIGDSVQVVDQSVQCMNNDRFLLSKNERSGSTFSIFNPVRTLHFLMQELEGKIIPIADNNVKHILMEMEDTLRRIPTNGKNFSPVTAEHLQNTDFCEQEPPQKLSKLTAAIQETKKSMGESRDKLCNESLQLKLELSCSKLEKACQEMEKACNELRKERDYFKNELHHKKKAYEELLKKETSYTETINDLKQNLVDMTTKADEHTRSIENLNIVLEQLQEENKVVCALKELHKKLNTRLSSVAQENEQLKSELQIATLEREKLSLLLASRDEELIKLKQDFGEVQEFVSDQLVNTSMRKDAVPLNYNVSAVSMESVQQKVTHPTPEPNNLTNSKSSTCFRSSVPSGWHVMNSEVTDTTALKSGNRTSSTDRKKNMTAANLIDSIRMLLSEMKQEPMVETKQSVPNYDTIEKYVVPQLSDTSMSSQPSAHDISQISSLSTLTL